MTTSLLLAVAISAAPTAQPAAPAAPAPDVAVPHGIDLAGMDKSVAPGDDFNAYVNGTWVKNTPIPPDRSSWGVGSQLVEVARKRTQELIQDSAKNAGTSPEAKKV